MHNALVVALNQLRVEILSRPLPDMHKDPRGYNSAVREQTEQLGRLTMRTLCVSLMALGFGRQTELLDVMGREARPRGRPGAQEPYTAQALATPAQKHAATREASPRLAGTSKREQARDAKAAAKKKAAWRKTQAMALEARAQLAARGDTGD
jgi:hypothetical protein